MKKFGTLFLAVMTLGAAAYADSSTPVGVVEQAADAAYSQDARAFCGTLSDGARSQYCNDAAMSRLVRRLSGYLMSTQLGRSWAGQNGATLSIVNVYGVTTDTTVFTDAMDMDYVTSMLVSCNGGSCRIEKFDRIPTSKN